MGAIDKTPLIILALVAALVCVSSLYVVEKTQRFEKSTLVQLQDGVAQQRFQWSLVTSWPKNFPGLGAAPENFATLVEAMSDGRLIIQVYGAGEIVPALGVFDAVSTGSVEMGHTAAYYHKGKIPAAPFFTSVPFGMNAQELNAWLFYGGGLQLWEDIYADFNILPMPGGNSGVQMAGLFNRQIHDIEDLRGLKMRIPGIAGEVFTQAGGAAVNIPGGELYTAMQTGVIDATEWVGPYNDRTFGLHQVAQYYYYPGWHETGSLMEFEINLDAWAELPADLQAIVRTAARAVNQDLLDEYTARNAQELQPILNAGLTLQQLPDEVLIQLRDVAHGYYQQLASEDPTFARVYAEYQAFFEEVSAWHQISEQALYNVRDLP